MRTPDPLFVTYWLGYANQKMIIEELPDGIDVINLFLINLDINHTLQHLYLTSNGMTWATILAGVRIQQSRGVKVLASITSNPDGNLSWNSVKDPALFAAQVYELVVNKWGLDGIDIDPEMGGDMPNDNFIEVVWHLSRYFGPRSTTGKTMSYVTYQYYADEQLLKQCNSLFNYVALMGYRWDLQTMVDQFQLYAGLVTSKKLLFGVKPGSDESTSLLQALQLTQWQPGHGLKGGMMLFNINIDKDFQYTNRLIKTLKNKKLTA